MAKHNFVSYDLETGGFDPIKNPITQISMIIAGPDKKEISRFVSYVQNEKGLEITKGATEVTGITAADMRLVNGITIKELYTQIVKILKPLKLEKYNLPIIVGHNVAKFDLMKFTEHLFKEFNDSIWNYIEGYVFDTQYHCRIKYMGKEVLGGFTLHECCEREGIDFSDAHNAENDTEANLKLAFQLMEEMQEGGSEGESNQGPKEEGVRGKFHI